MKGILFKHDMIKAIIEGRKTVTRRLSRMNEINKITDGWWLVAKYDDNTLFRFANDKLDKDLMIKPRYQVGETVYIKEAWAYHGCMNEMPADISTAQIEYLLDKVKRDVTFSSFEIMMDSVPKQNIKYPPRYHDKGEFEQERIHSDLIDKWWTRVHKGISPLFMPAWAARDFIKITDVRPKRLQEITELEAEAEGAPEHGLNAGLLWYKKLWDSINPKYPFSSNPWCWRYEFKPLSNKEV